MNWSDVWNLTMPGKLDKDACKQVRILWKPPPQTVLNSWMHLNLDRERSRRCAVDAAVGFTYRCKHMCNELASPWSFWFQELDPVAFETFHQSLFCRYLNFPCGLSKRFERYFRFQKAPLIVSCVTFCLNKISLTSFLETMWGRNRVHIICSQNYRIFSDKRRGHIQVEIISAGSLLNAGAVIGRIAKWCCTSGIQLNCALFLAFSTEMHRFTRQLRLKSLRIFRFAVKMHSFSSFRVKL